MKRSDFIKTTAAGLVSSLFVEPLFSQQYRKLKTLVLNCDERSFKFDSIESPNLQRTNVTSIFPYNARCNDKIYFSFTSEYNLGRLTYEKIAPFDLVLICTNDQRIYEDSEVQAVRSYVENGGRALIIEDTALSGTHGGFDFGQFMHKFGFIVHKYPTDQDARAAAGRGGYNVINLTKAGVYNQGNSFGESEITAIGQDPEICQGQRTVRLTVSTYPARITGRNVARPVLKPADRVVPLKVWHYVGSTVSGDMFLDYEPEIPVIHFKLGRGDGLYLPEGIYSSDLIRDAHKWLKNTRRR